MAGLFLFNLLLALIWTALTGQFTLLNFIFGFFISYAVLRLLRRPGEPLTYFQRASRALRFALFYLWKLILANLHTAAIVVAPLRTLRPAVIAVPLVIRSDAGITLLSNLITLTPGTLTLDVSDDRRVMYVHVMNMEDIGRLWREIKELERRVLEVIE